MADRYVDPTLSTGANDGSNKTGDAWWTLQDAIDGTNSTVPQPGETVYCLHTNSPDESLSATIAFAGIKGTADGHIRFIGCTGAGWAVDGTRYELDFGASAVDGVTFNDTDTITFENFEVESSVGSGAYDGINFITSSSQEMSLVNCYIHGWTGNGVEGASRSISLGIYGCHITDNDEYGISTISNDLSLVGCSIHGNTDGGVKCYTTVLYGCAIYENTGYGVYGVAGVQTIINSVMADNTGATADGVYIAGSYGALYGCRLTGNGRYGLNVHDSDFARVMGCFFDSNTTAATLGEVVVISPDGGSGWMDTSGGDADHGYIDRATDDYNLDPDEASMYSKALVLE